MLQGLGIDCGVNLEVGPDHRLLLLLPLGRHLRCLLSLCPTHAPSFLILCSFLSLPLPVSASVSVLSLSFWLRVCLYFYFFLNPPPLSTPISPLPAPC